MGRGRTGISGDGGSGGPGRVRDVGVGAADRCGQDADPGGVQGGPARHGAGDGDARDVARGGPAVLVGGPGADAAACIPGERCAVDGMGGCSARAAVTRDDGPDDPNVARVAWR